MGKKTPKAPPVPDPVDSINAQAQVNRVDKVSPYGSTRYVSNQPQSVKPGGSAAGTYNSGQAIPAPSGYGAPIDLGNGGYAAGDVRLSPVEMGGQMLGSASDVTQVNQLSPELQAIFERAVGTSLTDARAPFEERLLPQERYNVATTSPGSDRKAFDSKNFEDAFYQRQTRLLEPQLQQRESRLRQNLADRGLVEGSEAYNEALTMELDQANRMRQDAALASVIEGQGAFQQDRFAGLQEDTLRQQAFDADRDLARTLNNDDFARRFDLNNADRNYFLQRNQLGVQSDQAKFQQLASLLGLSPGEAIEPIDVQGAINNSTDAAFASYDSQVAQQRARQQRAAQDAQAAAMITAAFMSDRRLKTNIEQIGTTDQGHNLYSWDWKDGTGSSVGVMADEVPDRVIMREDGYLMVDYSGISWTL